MSIGDRSYEQLIFFVYPGPMGSEENQFTPLGVGVNKLIFKLFNPLYLISDVIIYIIYYIHNRTGIALYVRIFICVTLKRDLILY